MLSRLLLRFLALAIVLVLVAGQNGEEVCRIDVGLIVDDSGSITEPQNGGRVNWEFTLRFLYQLVNSFDIGPDRTKVAELRFSDKAIKEFDLNTHTTKESLIVAVNATGYTGLSTNTSGGLRMMRDEMFTEANGDRPDVRDVFILITDGVPTVEPETVAEEAQKVRDRGIRLIAIGVTSRVNSTLLRSLVTAPADDNFFFVENFEQLILEIEAIVQSSCVAPPTSPPPPIDCSNNVDVLLVLDSSGSIRRSNWNLILNWAVSLTEALDIGGLTRLAVLKFSTEVTIAFDFDDHMNKTNAAAAIRALSYDRGTTNTAAVLEQARELIENPSSGVRESVPKLIVILTDGGSNDKIQTQVEAKATKDAQITIVVVCISNYVDWNEINGMASYPPDLNIKKVEDVSTLGSIQEDIKNIMCNNINDCDNVECENEGTCVDLPNGYICQCAAGFIGQNCDTVCEAPLMDLVIIADLSGSIGAENFRKEMEFLRTVILGLDTAGTHLAVETFADEAKLEFSLSDYESKLEMLNALTIHYTGGRTNTSDALRLARTVAFAPGGGERADVPNMIVLITDGESSDPEKTLEEARAARLAEGEYQGATIVTVGVGDYVHRDELDAIASRPELQFYVGNFDDLGDLSHDIMEALCNNADDCASTPCGDHGQCVDLVGGFLCTCEEGYSGRYCNISDTYNGVGDLIFVIDRSGSIRVERFPLVIEYIVSIVRELTVDDSHMRIGVLAFSDDSEIIFNLITYHTKHDIIQAIKRIVYTGGRTNTQEALAQVRLNMFQAAAGDREDAPNHVIVFTDGNSNIEHENTVPNAIELKVESEAHIVVVAVGADLDLLELRGIASHPYMHNLFHVESIISLTDIIDNATLALGNGVNECEPNPCENSGTCEDLWGWSFCECAINFVGENCVTECIPSRRLYVMLIVDTSGSLEIVYNQARAIAEGIIYGLELGQLANRVALLSYATEAHTHFTFADTDYSTDKQNALAQLAFPEAGGTTNAAAALDAARALAVGGEGLLYVAVVITDGNSNVNPQDTLPKAQALKDLNVVMITVGIGENQNTVELEGMASEPIADRTSSMLSPADVSSTVERVVGQLCGL